MESDQIRRGKLHESYIEFLRKYFWSEVRSGSGPHIKALLQVQRTVDRRNAWRQVAAEYVRLEAEALRLYNELPEEYRDAYFELILFPVQAMANLYDMYYAQAMNHRLYKAGDPLANQWAQKVKDCFRRDRILCDDYNKKCAAGKWDGMMIQKHIGYKSWNDDFPEDKEPEVFLVSDTPRNIGGYESTGRNGVAVIEAEHFFSQTAH